MPSNCPVCGKPLARSTGLVFKGDRLVHARCWREERPDALAGKPATHRRAPRPAGLRRRPAAP